MARHVARALGNQIIGYVEVKDIVRPTEETTNGNRRFGDVEYSRPDDTIVHCSASCRESKIHAPQHDLDGVPVIGRLGAGLSRPLRDGAPSCRHNPRP
jgi:hypothetical protein